ncbi:MAG: hypothetical protein KKE37_08770 [Verrucomicrobia bacterium]|nr:hypothetical protein [Verrucomicrobiota bacterium]MBU4292154.1 hypothetical protein [Verrucomicrobiota bacterium]MBU4429428.1 hypothetical protein [Verrucomicrobiota bacterium]MCG2681599.1 hypothetical protein [Kiritimatiellia bacterium]
MSNNVWQQFLDLESLRYPLFTHDPERKAASDEVEIDTSWQIRVSDSEEGLAKVGAQELARFLEEVMCLTIPVLDETVSPGTKNKWIRILSAGGGIGNSPESFTLEIEKGGIVIKGATPQGALQGSLYLEDLMGVEGAPVLRQQETVRWPRLPFRFGTIRRPSANLTLLRAIHNGVSPILSYEDEFLEILRQGYNCCWIAAEELWDIAVSSVLPEMQTGKARSYLPYIQGRVRVAKRLGLKTCVILRAWKTLPENYTVFQTYPDAKGARKLSSESIFPDEKDNKCHTLCTESGIVKQFISESITNLFAKTGLDVLTVLVGGEAFHHCFMRPMDCKKGHTDCPKCEPLGAEAVVANLVNLLAEAARKANPEAQILTWPYSACWAWSKEDNQESWIRLLKPEVGAVLLTEVEKDEIIEKGGYLKDLWDYSIDLVEPGPKCRSQIALCKESGLPIYLKTEPTLTLEFMHVAHLPCIDRWVDRAIAIAQSGANGVFAMQGCYGRPPSIAQYIAKWFWWAPNPNREEILDKIARMVAGVTAANHVRRAWSLFSEAMGYMPILAAGYIRSPTYLGPAHPLLLDPEEKLPRKFYSIECTLDIEVEPSRPSRPAFVAHWTFSEPQMRDWHKMADLSRRAVEELDQASPLAPEHKKLLFLNEYFTLKHLALTIRTCVNVAEFYQVRDALAELVATRQVQERRTEARELYHVMKTTAMDELACAKEDVLPVESHPLLDYPHQGDGTHFHHTKDILQAKIEHTQQLITCRLPDYAKRLGLEP